MALAASLAELRAEACCPVCHDFLQEPVTLECGHNCCGSCLQQRWEHLQDILPCPVCLHPCTDGHPQKNTQLGDLIDLVQQILCMRKKNSEKEENEEEVEEEEEGRGRCERHQQALSLFCEDDLELLCGQCAASPDHQAHDLTPIAEAAAHHRTNLKNCLWHLGERLEEAVRALERKDAEFTELKGQLKLQKQNVTQEGSHLMQYLRKQDRSIGKKLVHQKSGIYRHMLLTKQQLSRVACTWKELLTVLQKACLQADAHLLQDAAALQLAWRQRQRLGFPEVPSWKHKEESLSLPPNYIGLDNMRAKFQVHLILDPETAHPDLLISHQTTASYCQEGAQTSPGMRPRAFTSRVAVLGALGFRGGRHFWQVEIRGLGVWCLGVCTEAFSRDTRAAQTPRNGCWQVPVTVSLSLPRLPRGKAAVACFGVFLDYELGEISFYNMSKKTHLHTLTGTFTERLVPYFSHGHSQKNPQLIDLLQSLPSKRLKVAEKVEEEKE
ncbi:tripartite motif-containing protein 75-like [Suncus etruscus]|uniref:tripartite motif-containing protein 75-like n=1 Tax=Suncus etruscus TaxID=109475 RepID=UPI002110A490|nr:tripartite motif-containing protein 75-like [Suncus etruscus]